MGACSRYGEKKMKSDVMTKGGLDGRKKKVWEKMRVKKGRSVYISPEKIFPGKWKCL